MVHTHEEVDLKPREIKGAARIGIGGPVGSGKTALVETITRQLAASYSIAVVTNDIYTREDAEFLIRRGVLPAERIRGVETGACPHSAVREDASMNVEAIEDLTEKLGHLDLILIESGGDNLSASFSPDLVDGWIYVIDVSAGDKIPRKGGPGIGRSDLLLINKTDLAPLVGASLDIMQRDTEQQRGSRPFYFTNLKSGEGVADVIGWVREFIASKKR